MTVDLATIANGRPEVALLLSCARTRARPSSTTTIAALLLRPLNWDALLAMADRHGLSSLLYWRLSKDFRPATPDDVMARLKERFDWRVKRNLLLAGELISLLRLFEAHGVEAIPWKGPTLAACAHGNLALREFDDLDILVRRTDLYTASDLLRSKGYYSPDRFTARQEETYLWSRDERVFINQPKGVMVELHWAIMPKAFSFRLQFDRFWERPTSLDLAGASLRAMSPEHLLLTLCVHGSKHCWARLSLVCDISEFVDAHDRLDWALVRSLARESTTERMLLLGLFLAHKLFGTNIPLSLHASAAADRQVPVLVDGIINGFFARRASPLRERESSASADTGSHGFPFEPDRPPSIRRMFLFHLRAREALGDRIRYLAWQIVPTVGDWSWIALPDGFFPIYYVIRPFRLAAKYVTAPLFEKFMVLLR